MALEVGSRLGHYDVTALIGEGGMGQVYQATDTNLDRQVAIKVLPDAFSSDADRLARFEREAKVLASLNHPNIGAIYGLEKSDETRALVLELVEGPTLADRIAQGAIPIDEALPIAKQIAEALEAAHEAGVIHRDLKPANIKVRDDGTVKVLDFGLAKALDTAPEGDPSQSPTLTAAATQMGVIMGTAAYMSPEQARGKPVDRRADIWAVGCVLYEMLTGTRAFQGDDVSQTLARVIERDPDWDALPAGLSLAFQTYLRRCFRRDPRERIRDIGDVRLALAGAFDTVAGAPTDAGGPQRAGGRPSLPAAVGIAIVSAVFAGGLVWGGVSPPASEDEAAVRFTVETEATGGHLPGLIAFAPDGETLVYELTSGLYRRHLGRLDADAIEGAATGRSPFFSPDGAWMGFVAGGTLLKLNVNDGVAALLASLPPGAALAGATWGSDDSIIFALRGSPLQRVSAEGGGAEPITTVATEAGERDHRWPAFLPDGRAVLFTIWRSADDSEVAVHSFETGEAKTLVTGTYPRYIESGHLLFARPLPGGVEQGAIWAAPFDIERLEITGEPRPVIDNVHLHVAGSVQVAIADDGSLAYVDGEVLGHAATTLAWIERSGAETELTGLVPGDYRTPQVSPDGSAVAFARDGDIWTYDTDRTTGTSLTSDAAFDLSPRWTPDGSRIVFNSTQAPGALLWKAADGSGGTERIELGPPGGNAVAMDVTPNGTHVLFRSGGGLSLASLSMGDDEPVTRLLDPADAAALSPDGRWLAYASRQSGRSEVYVERFPMLGQRVTISTDGGASPAWSPRGDELFYMNLEGTQIMSAKVRSQLEFTAERPEVVLTGVFEPPESANNDGRFIVLRRSTGFDEGVPITVVLNWIEEFKEEVFVN